MKTKRFNLLTTCLVSALHPNQPFGAGTKWEPTNTIDQQEAKEMVILGYAEEWGPLKEDVLERTWLQKQDDAKAAAAVDEGFEPGAVTEDDDDLAAILDGSVEVVAGELEGLNVDQLRRLAALEEQRERPRKGVAEAINDAIAALEENEEDAE